MEAEVREILRDALARPAAADQLGSRVRQTVRAQSGRGDQSHHNREPPPACRNIRSVSGLPSIGVGGLRVESPPTGTVTFLFTDIEGSTRRWQDEPEAMRALLVEHDAILRDVIDKHRGHLFKHTGDGVAAVFASAADAVSAAVDAQARLRGRVAGADGVAHRRGRVARRRLFRFDVEPVRPADGRRARRPGRVQRGDGVAGA